MADITPNKIRVMIITKSTGGLASYNLRLCTGLDKDKFDLTIICLSDSNVEYANELSALGFRALPMEMERYAINFQSDLGLIRKLRDYLNKNPHDIIMGLGSKSGFIARVLGRTQKVIGIYQLASMSFLPRIHGNKAHVYRALEHVGNLFGGHIVVLSKITKHELLTRKLASEEDVTIIYTGIDIDYFNPQPFDRVETCKSLNIDPNRPVIGWAARFVPQKAPLDFVNAMAIVCKERPDVQIVMAGEGQLKDETLKLVNSLGLNNNFIFLPWQQDVPRLLASFSIYVLNSHWEGLPQSLLEAMAMELPSVVTAVDGNVEVINHGKNGYLVPLYDLQELAKHLIMLVDDPEKQKEMGYQARERVKELFTIDKMIGEWEKLFTNLVISTKAR